MDSSLSMNTLRIVLVGITALASVISFALGQPLVGAVLVVACLIHGGVWVLLQKQKDAEHAQLHAVVESMLRDEG